MNKGLVILSVFVILSNLYSVLAEPDINNEICSEDFTKLNPSFSLIVSNKNYELNKGDYLEFEIYITGYGAVTNTTKIYASLPIDLVDSNTTYGFVKYFYISNIEGGKYATLNNLKRAIKPLDVENGFGIFIPSYYYSQVFNVTYNCYTDSILTENKVKISNEFTAPILIKIKTSETAPEGDNKIDLFFTYSDGKNVYQDKNEVKFHINSPKEQHDILYSVLIILIGAMAVAISSLIWNYVTIKVKSNFKNKFNGN